MKRHDKDGFPYFCRICGKAWKWNNNPDKVAEIGWRQGKSSGGDNCPFFPSLDECMLEDEETAQARMPATASISIKDIVKKLNDYTYTSEVDPPEVERIKQIVISKSWTKGHNFIFHPERNIIKVDGIEFDAATIINGSAQSIEALLEIKLKELHAKSYYIPNPRLKDWWL